MTSEYVIGIQIFEKGCDKIFFDQEYYFRDKDTAFMVYLDIEKILDTLHLTLSTKPQKEVNE